MNDEFHFIAPTPRWLSAPLPPKAAPLIVLVDDEPDFTALLRCMIQEAYPDARVRMFANGDVAWKFLEQQSPDLLISDLNHCGMDGFQMLSRLAEKGVTYPIWILSGYLPELIRRARHCAGPRLRVQFLVKPQGLQQIVPLLEQCVNQPNPAEALLPSAGSAGRPLKIVHLDDEELFVHLIATLLRRRFTHLQLFQFQHSPSAWRILTEARPDLLITDDIMSGDREWNGEGIVRRLAARQVTYPIMVMSGWPPTENWVCRMGMDFRKYAFLRNPFTLDQFYGELDRLLKLPHLPPPGEAN